jgi:hypothetical protein
VRHSIKLLIYKTMCYNYGIYYTPTFTPTKLRQV